MSGRKLLTTDGRYVPLSLNDEDYEIESESDDCDEYFEEKFNDDCISKKSKWMCGVGTLAVIVVAVLLLVFLIGGDSEDDTPSNAPMGVYSKAAVVANGYLCAPIGKDIFVEGGNAVEAAIATLLCEGVLNPHSMGIGGGFLMTIYLRESKRAVVLNARETAPLKAHKDMYHGNATWSLKGGLSVAVPGELRGYEAAFNKYKSGKVTWRRLFEPTIAICRNGYNLTEYQAKIYKANEADILASPGLRELFVDKSTGHVYGEGATIRFPKLADTLELVAYQRADAIYNSALTNDLVKEINEDGGIFTRDDFAEYKVQWQKPVRAVLNNHTMYSVPLPGSGDIVAFIINLLDGLLPASDQVTTYQRIIESFKFGFGRRTELGDFSDPSYVPDADFIQQLISNLTSPAYAAKIRKLISDEKTYTDPAFYGAVWETRRDHGTAHVSVLGPNGDAVSVTSTINQYFGSQLVSESSGIFFNDEMDDFSSPNITNGFDLPPSPANFIFPGKRPLSSMVPTIFVDPNGDVSLVTGAAGGSKITTTTVQLALHTILYGKTIKEALDATRVHHQLFPMSITYEDTLPKEILNGLQEIGHIMTTSGLLATATGIGRQGTNVTACYDFRRGGSIDGL